MSTASNGDSPAKARQELVARLRKYLSALSEDSRAMLVRTIDRARTRGDESPVHAIIMEAVRDVPAAAESPQARALSAERRFFDPIEPFLIASPVADKVPGRIERASLRAIWIWITRDLAPGRLDGSLARLQATVADDDHEAIKGAVVDFRRAFSQAARQIIRKTQETQGSLLRIEAQLGGPRALADMREAIEIFEQAPVIEALLARTSDPIPAGQPALDALSRVARIYGKAPDANAFLGYCAMLNRLEAPGELVRHAAQTAQSSDPSDIRNTVARGAIEATLAQIRVEADLLLHLLAEDRTLARVVGSLRRVDELTAVVSRTLDDAPNDPWLKELTNVRVQLGNKVGAELEPLLRMIREVIGVVEANGHEIVPDETSIGEAVFGTSLFVAVRDARESLALNSAIERLEREIEKVLESQAKQAIERLANTSDEGWDAALARSRAAVLLLKAYFGSEYGASMARRQAKLVENRALAEAS